MFIPKVGSAYVSIRARLDKLEKDLNAGHSKTLKSARKTQKAVSNIFKATVGFFAFRSAFRVLSGAMQSIVDKSNLQIEADTKLAAVIKSTGSAAGFSADQLKEYAAQLQEVTTFGDEVTESAAAVLLTFTNLHKDVFKRALKASMDLSTVLGTNLNSAVLQLGKALNDPVANMGALSRAGIQFSKDQKALIKNLVESGNLYEAQNIMLKEMERQFGGVAEAAAKTFGGSVKQLGNIIGDFQEKLGENITKSKGWSDLINDLKATFTDENFQRSIVDAAENISRIALAIAKLSKYAGLRSITGTIDQANELSRQGLLDLTEFFKLSFTERQRLVDDIIAKQKQIEESALKIALHGAAPLPSTGPESIYNPWGSADTKADSEALQGIVDNMATLTGFQEAIAAGYERAEEKASKFLKTIENVDDELTEFFDAIENAATDSALNDFFDDLDKYADKLKKLREYMKGTFEGWANSFGSTLNDMVWNADASFDKILKSFGQMITQMYIQKKLIDPLIESAEGSSAWTWLFNKLKPSAHGNVFSGPGISAYENKIVTRPTLFPFASGIGLMGEAGDEAILPLTRTSSGDLGVKSSGGGNLEVHIHNNVGAEVSVQQRQTSSGQELEIYLDQAVAKKLGQYGSYSNKAIRQMGAQQPRTVR